MQFISAGGKIYYHFKPAIVYPVLAYTYLAKSYFNHWEEVRILFNSMIYRALH